jgi:RNA polymerase sigma-70 factor (ECF subfamily)
VIFFKSLFNGFVEMKKSFISKKLSSVLCFPFFVVLYMKMELETFKIVVLPLREKLLHLSFRMTEDMADSEDIVQEAFLKLWNIREKLDEYNSIEALAVQVTKNLALDKIKLRKPEGPKLENLVLDSGYANPSKELEEKDAITHIRKLIETLPSLQQTIIHMKDIEGYELSEIAEITGTQIEAVRVNLSRARKKIREQFLKLNR